MARGIKRAETIAELRRFGLLIGGTFLVLSLIPGYRYIFSDRSPILFGALVGIGLFLVLGAALQPAWLRGFNRFWCGLADWLGRYVGHYIGLALFAILYFLAFTPIALMMKLFGSDPLGLKAYKDSSRSSYWHSRRGPLTSDHYEKQYSMEKD